MENMDWRNLGFGYMKTDYNVRCYYRNGKWGRLELHSEEFIPMHMAATCLHYGQEAFEGQKAFMGKDGKVRVFRIEENAKRMQSSADYLQMQPVPVDLFVEAVKMVVDANRRFVPPYGTGATLYIRPLLIGSGAKVGVNPSDEYLFIVFVTPVGPYYKEGFHPIRVMIDRDHDRAAPRGTGHVKAGGNYGASLISEEVAHQLGYPGILYLDSAEKKYIDECGTSNFFAIRGGKYITPHSHSILPSITNLSLRTIAEKELGLGIEQRKVEASELPTFEEVGCCGTAAVISPIKTIYDPQTGETFVYCDGDEAGPVCTKLFHRLQGIQFGESEDTYGWMTEI